MSTRQRSEPVPLCASKAAPFANVALSSCCCHVESVSSPSHSTKGTSLPLIPGFTFSCNRVFSGHLILFLQVQGLPDFLVTFPSHKLTPCHRLEIQVVIPPSFDQRRQLRLHSASNRGIKLFLEDFCYMCLSPVNVLPSDTLLKIKKKNIVNDYYDKAIDNFQILCNVLIIYIIDII